MVWQTIAYYSSRRSGSRCNQSIARALWPSPGRLQWTCARQAEESTRLLTEPFEALLVSSSATWNLLLPLNWHYQAESWLLLRRTPRYPRSHRPSRKIRSERAEHYFGLGEINSQIGSRIVPRPRTVADPLSTSPVRSTNPPRKNREPPRCTACEPETICKANIRSEIASSLNLSSASSGSRNPSDSRRVSRGARNFDPLIFAPLTRIVPLMARFAESPPSMENSPDPWSNG